MRRSIERSIALLGSLVMTLVIVLPPAAVAQPEGSEPVEVRVLLYSGRPDPVFEVDASDDLLAELRALLDSGRVASFQGETVTPSILGYKGLLISNREGRGGLPERVALYRGVIESSTAGETRFVEDPDRRLESRLLRLAVATRAVDGELLDSEGIPRREESGAPEE